MGFNRFEIPGFLRSLAPAVVLFWGSYVSAAAADEYSLIDAHSQIDHFVDRSEIVPLMDKAGIHHVILSARGKVKPEQITAFAAKHPGRVTASVRTKGRHYAQNKKKYYKLLNKQLRMPGFGAMAELILWHAQKGDKAPEWVIPPDAPQVQAALRGAVKKGWPFIIHIEFAAARSAKTFMKKMEAMLDQHPDHLFALIHMGQLKAKEVTRLLAAHKNLYFLMSSANPIHTTHSKHPWIDMFDGSTALAPRWRALMTEYPERFVLAFDNVWVDHWGTRYVRQAELWKKALSDLPHDVAHAVAHKNAERLWKLPTGK